MRNASFLYFMDFDGIWVLFSYFDTSIGPTSYKVKPSLDETLQKRINNLMDIDIDNSRFEHSFQVIKTFNHMFYIESPISRGGNLLCMLTICVEEFSEGSQKIYEKLQKYVDIIKRYPKLYLLLTAKNLRKEDLKERQQKLDALIDSLYNEVKDIPGIGYKIVPMMIPGFFRYKNENSINSFKSWVPFENELEFFKEPVLNLVRFQFKSAYSSWKRINESLLIKERNKIKYLLMGSFISLKLEKFETAYQLAESALELSKKTPSLELQIDAILLIIKCGAHLGMIMIFETAFRSFDASCGLSNFILQNYNKFLTLLEEGQKLLEECDISKPDIKVRKALLLEFLGKFRMLGFKTGMQSFKLEEAIALLKESYKILKSYPFNLQLIQNRVNLSLAYEILKKYKKTSDLLDDAFKLISDLPKNLQHYYIAWILQRKGWNYLHTGYIKETMDKFQHSVFEIHKISNERDREILLAKTQMRICYILSFQQADIGKVLPYYKASQAILKKYNEEVELTRLYYVIGDIFKAKGLLTDALNYYEKCEELAKKIKDQESLGISLARKAKIAAQTLHLDQALEYYHKALSYFKKINHFQFLGITQGEIGAVYQALNEKSNALRYYQLGLDSFRNEGNELESYWILYKLVSLLLTTDLDQAKRYASKLKKLGKKTNSDIITQASKLVEALILTQNSNLRERLKSIFLLEQIVEEKIIQHHLSHAALMHLCDLLLSEILVTYDDKSLKDLSKYLDKLASISQEFHLSHELIEIYILSSKLSSILNDFEETEQFIQQALELDQSLKIYELTTKINKEIAIINEYQKEIESSDLQNQTLKERLVRLNFENEMKMFIQLFNI